MCAAAAFTLCSNCVGLDNCKLAFVELVPGYMHEHSVRSITRDTSTTSALHIQPCTPVASHPVRLLLALQAFGYDHPVVV